jgi:hypothetical protein
METICDDLVKSQQTDGTVESSTGLTRQPLHVCPSQNPTKTLIRLKQAQPCANHEIRTVFKA